MQWGLSDNITLTYKLITKCFAIHTGRNIVLPLLHTVLDAWGALHLIFSRISILTLKCNAHERAKYAKQPNIIIKIIRKACRITISKIKANCCWGTHQSRFDLV